MKPSERKYKCKVGVYLLSTYYVPDPLPNDENMEEIRHISALIEVSLLRMTGI